MDMDAATADFARALEFLKCANPDTIDIHMCPAMAPPKNTLPMDPNAYSLRPAMITVTAIALALLLPSVAVRTYTRKYLHRKLGVEDFAVIMAMISCIAFLGLILKSFDYNCGKHQWNVSIADTMNVLRYANLIQLLYSPPIFFAKLAILMQISRIFSGGQRNYIFWASWIFIIGNGIAYTIVMFLFIFECNPREKIWNPMKEGSCMNTGDAVIGISVVNLVSDILILLLPIISVWKLQMPLRKKMGVMGIFAIGVFACACGIARIIYTVKLIDTMDVTFWATVVGMWSVAEIVVVILCCCFPTFPRFILYIRGRDESGKKLSSGSTPLAKGSPVYSSQSSKSSPKKSPWSMYETNMTGNTTLQGDEELGPYQSLEERKIGYYNENPREMHEQWFRQGRQPGGLGIWRTTELEQKSTENMI